MTEIPSALLLRAADLIRDLAAKAEPGPWTLVAHGSVGIWIGTPAYEHAIPAHGFPDEARWIALLNPSVAPAIEAVLREAAEAYDSAAAGSVAVEDNWLALAALNLARAVLGLVDTPEEAK